MSLERKIERLIDAINNDRRSRERGERRDGRRTRRRDRDADPIDDDTDTETDAETNRQTFFTKIGGKLGDKIGKDFKRAIKTELKSGLTLDETDFDTLFDPFARALSRFEKERMFEKDFFEQFGTTIAGVGTAGRQMAKEFELAGAESEKLYGSAELGFETYTKLSERFGAFIGLTSTQRTELVNTTMAMEKLGFETGDVAVIMDNSTRSMGLSADEALRTTAQLGKLRTELNMGARDIAENYISAQEKLVYSSGRVNRIFTDLQRTSRITGIGFNELMTNFGSGFDTFEGAAQKAGGLNALLGGNLFNSLELLEMDEAERLSKIVDTIRGSVDVNALVTDKFNLKAIANQLGLSDADTRRLLLGETGVADALAKSLPDDTRTVLGSENEKMATTLQDLREVFVKARGRLSEELLEFANSINDVSSKFFKPFLGDSQQFTNTGLRERLSLTTKSETGMLMNDQRLFTAEERAERVRLGVSEAGFEGATLGDQLSAKKANELALSAAAGAAASGIGSGLLMGGVVLTSTQFEKLSENLDKQLKLIGPLAQRQQEAANVSLFP